MSDPEAPTEPFDLVAFRLENLFQRAGPELQQTVTVLHHLLVLHKAAAAHNRDALERAIAAAWRNLDSAAHMYADSTEDLVASISQEPLTAVAPGEGALDN